jgi:hypothetical protein
MKDEYINVPLVIYIDGVRKVIGEAVVKGDQVLAAIDSDTEESRKLIDVLSHPTSAFSFGYSTTAHRASFQERNVFDRSGIVEEPDPKIDLSNIPFLPDQQPRQFMIKEPNWWEGLKMDPTHEEEK